MTKEQIDYDSPWKEVLDRFLPQFLELFFPERHAGIDWSGGYALMKPAPQFQ